jgi:hypothetical protein
VLGIEGKAGRRFQQRYARRRAVPCGALKKWMSMLAGAVVVLVGIVLLPLPGPGMLVVLFGAALMAGHSLAIARVLDRAELTLRRRLSPLAARFRARRAAWRASRTPARPPAASPMDAPSASSHAGPGGTASDHRTFRPR